MIPKVRLRRANTGLEEPRGDYVLYWMIAARRLTSSYALDHSLDRARELGKPLGEVVSEAVLSAYGERASGAVRRNYKLPVSGKGGLRPGVDLDDSSALADLMDGRG